MICIIIDKSRRKINLPFPFIREINDSQLGLSKRSIKLTIRKIEKKLRIKKKGTRNKERRRWMTLYIKKNQLPARFASLREAYALSLSEVIIHNIYYITERKITN